MRLFWEIRELMVSHFAINFKGMDPNTQEAIVHPHPAKATKNPLFPVFLKTENRHFLLVGAGNVGLEKTLTLLRQNPETKITIVAETFHPDFVSLLQKHPQLQGIERSFEPHDLAGIDFLILATGDRVLNAAIKSAANQRSILVNAADQPELCDFYLGAIVNKGSLKIAISTNGQSPVMARRLKEYFAAVIPDDIEEHIADLNVIRKEHTGDLKEKLEQLNALTAPLSGKKSRKKYRRLTFEITLAFFAIFLGYGLSSFISFDALKAAVTEVPNIFYVMLAVGFFAQLVDGAVGLGYGVVCSTSMMLAGVKLPAISGSIHTAEMFSSGISGYSHYKFGNVNKKLFLSLVIPGVVGAVSGSMLLVYLGNKYETLTYVILASYTMIIGVRLILIAFRKKVKKQPVKRAGLLGFSGGFLDAFGGGGWGPVVTSSLLAKGKKSSMVVGTVSLTEFFVTLSASLTFFFALGVSHGFIVAGLIIGGALAAPIAAKLAGKIPQKIAVLSVALLVIIFSVRLILKLI